jgi:hypothetical protein
MGSGAAWAARAYADRPRGNAESVRCLAAVWVKPRRKAWAGVIVSAVMGLRGEIWRAKPAVHAAGALAGACGSDCGRLLITRVNLSSGRSARLMLDGDAGRSLDHATYASRRWAFCASGSERSCSKPSPSTAMVKQQGHAAAENARLPLWIARGPAGAGWALPLRTFPEDPTQIPKCRALCNSCSWYWRR